MISKTLKQVIDSIYAEKDKISRELTSETNEFRKINLQFELDTVTNEKVAKIYHEIIDNIPRNKDSELKDIVVNLLGSNEDFERLTKNVKVHYPNATFRDVCHGVSTYTIVQNFDNLIENLSNVINDEAMNKVATSIQNFVPGSIDNTPIHPCSNIIQNIKNGDKFNSLSEADKLLVSKQLDEINEVVKESPRRYSDAQTNFDIPYEHVINMVNDAYYKNYINNQNPDFSKAFTYRDSSFLIKDDVADDPEKISIAKSPTFALSPQTQQSILKVWEKMDELGIITAGNGAESGKKIYGFAKLFDARTKINNALESEQFDNLSNLKAEYEKQVQNVREMYKIIKTELNPSPDKIPGNVQNFRENFVPAEFKNDICTNATFNGLYNAYTIVKSLGLTATEFLQNSQKYIDKIFNDELTKFHIDKLFNGLSFEETLARVYVDKTRAGINSHGIPRMMSTLNLFEKDSNQKKNNLIYCAVQTGKIEFIFDDPQISYNYFSQEKTNSFINLLFVNPEDRNFDNLRSFDSVTGDRLHKTHAFDLANYLQEKNIPAEAINERITNFLTTAYNLSYNSEKEYNKQKTRYEALLKDYKEGKIKTAPEKNFSQTLSRESFVQMVKDIQQGVIDYVMLSNSERDPGIDKLTEILRDPAEALKTLNIDDSYIIALNNLKGKDILINEYKQNAIMENTLDIKNIRLNETLYNKNVDRILKEANKISAKVERENDINKIEELQKQSVIKMNELKQLQKEETDRLNDEYRAGKLPSDYFKQRTENILSLNHNEKIAIFDDGLDKDAYIKSTGLEQLSKSEKNKLFECEIQKQKVAKEIFINKQFLQNKKLISTNRDIEVQKANFEQIDVSQIDSTMFERQREPLVVDEAKIKDLNQKSEPKQEIDPKETVKLP